MNVMILGSTKPKLPGSIPLSTDPEKIVPPDDLAGLMIAQLKLNRRVFVKEAGIWSGNP
jgi:hypothetical protein